jgi:L-ornithine N5-oxygenase
VFLISEFASSCHFVHLQTESKLRSLPPPIHILFIKMEEIQISHQAKKPQPSTNQIYDMICVGFGTAGLGLAVALRDSDIKGNVIFLESRPQFEWHEQVENNADDHMQISFAQDLATMRDPTSEFSFLNYLRVKESLDSFINTSGSPFPLRQDFNDYLSWSASQLNDFVKYEQEVVAVTPVSPRELPVNLWTVTSKHAVTQETQVLVAKNVAMAIGAEAKMVQHPAKSRDKFAKATV